MDSKMTIQDFIHRVRLGSYHQRGALLSLECYRLGPDVFNSLYAEVRTLVDKYSGVDARTGRLDYVQPDGSYIVHSLIHKYRNGDQVYIDMDSAWSKTVHNKRFWAGIEFPVLAWFINSFPEAMNFTIKTFKGKANIAPHEERVFHLTKVYSGETKKYFRVRLHLPIQSQVGAGVVVRDRKFIYSPGIVYFL